MNEKMKFCKHCGESIPEDAVICTKCGRQVEKIEQVNASQPNVVINNTNTANARATAVAGEGRAKNKWTSFLLCIFLGYLGAHKFYEGRVGLGILYLLTFGLFGFGWAIDTIVILFKPNPYYV